jgi:Fe-S cluster biogenesis protein NfuA
MDIKEKVTNALNKVRPHLQADGGDVELVRITDDNVVEVKLKGACGCCPMATMTLQQGVARVIKQEVPEVKDVKSV